MKHFEYLPNFSGALLIIGLLLGLEMIFFAAFYDVGIVFTHGDASGSVITVLANGVIISVIMHLSGLKYADLFHPSASTVSGTVGLLFFPVVLVEVGALWWLTDIAFFLESFFPQDDASLRMLDNLMSSGYVTLISICLVAPFVEEMLFRGIILRGFLTYYSPQKSIFLSAVLFGMVHMNIYQIPSAFVFGCFSGWLFYRSRSVWPCVIGHAVHNFGVFVFFQFEQLQYYDTHLVSLFTFSLSGLGVWLIHSILREGTVSETNNSARDA